MRTLLLASTVSMLPIAFASAPPAPAAKADRVEPTLTDVFKIDMPARVSKRGSESKYPFDKLTETGTAFGVKNKTAAQLSSIVSNANRKAQVQATDDAGNALFNTKELTSPDGTKTVVTDNESPKMVAGRHFYAVDVDAELKKKIKGTPLDGSTALVYRDK